MPSFDVRTSTIEEEIGIGGENRVNLEFRDRRHLLLTSDKAALKF